MPDYQKMYHILFSEISIAIEILQKAQYQTEEIYISSPDSLSSLTPFPEKEPPEE